MFARIDPFGEERDACETVLSRADLNQFWR